MRTTSPILQPRGAEFSGKLGNLQVFVLAFGAILGAGWIVGLGLWLQQAGAFGAVIGLCVGTAVIATVALCYAEAGTLYPTGGGEVEYATQFFGELAGYTAGWLLAVTYVCVCAFEALSVGWLTDAMALQSSPDVAYSVFGTAVTTRGLLTSLGSIVVVAAVNFRGSTDMARAQQCLGLALLLASVGFVAVGLGRGSVDNLRPLFVSDASGNIWKGLAAIVVTAPFWFSGFGVVSYALGDLRSPTQLRWIGWILIGALLASLVFYCAVLLAAAMALPRDQLLRLELPASGAFAAAFGSTALSEVVLLTGVIGLLMALNAMLFAASQVIRRLSECGVPNAGRDAKGRVKQSTSILFVAALAAAAALLGRGVIGELVNISAVAICCVYVLICLGVFRSRRWTSFAAESVRYPRGAVIPLIATILTIGMLGLAVWSIGSISREQRLFECVVLGLSTLIGAAIWLRRRHFTRESRA
jgi:APA family basic amino acid/polyamine antiporter